MEDIRSIFTEETIEYYKNHKDEITSELLSTLRMHGNEGKQIALDILDTEMDDDSYYLDSFKQRICFRGKRDIKCAYTKMSLSPIHIEEIKKCSESLEYFKNNYVKIRTKDGINFPELRKYQDDFLKVLDSDAEKIVSLQPRQSGKSIGVSIYITHKLNFDKDKNIGICANEHDLAREFLQNIQNIFVNLPMWMQVGIRRWNNDMIETENKMKILTDGPSKKAFRGFTISLLVVDETAFIDPKLYKVFIDSVAPSQGAMAWKKTIFISTANGMNHFYEIVRDAKKRKKFIDLDEKKYIEIKEKYKDKILNDVVNLNGLRDVTIDESSNGFTFYEVNWRDVPRYNSKGEKLDPDDFKEQTVSTYGLVYFNQNYGNEFLGSSYTLLNADVLRGFESKEPEVVWDNRLCVYELPQKGHKYIMGIDPAKGSLDAFGIQILDITTLPFRQVARAQLYKCNYQIMPEFICEWGNRYNRAYLIIENNEGAGTFIANMLYTEFEYDNMYYTKKSSRIDCGFRTTGKSRDQILDTMKQFADNFKVIIIDDATTTELNTFILKDDKYQADSGCHDDLVMSLALCFVPFIDSRNFEDMKELIQKIYSKDNTELDVTDYMIIGDFDDYTDDYNLQKGSFYDDELIIDDVINFK